MKSKDVLKLLKIARPTLCKIEKRIKYAGKRIKRGIFITSKGELINSDINGSLNILRKVIGDEFLSNRGNVSLPYRISLC